MKKKKIRRIPKFKNLEEEARFWDTHSLADYWSDFKDIDIVVDLQKPKTETLVLRIQKNFKDRLDKIAKTKGLNISSLIRLWIGEKLQFYRSN